MRAWIQVILLSMAPISELRGAIPLGILVYHLNPMTVAFISMLFNMVPAVGIILFFNWAMPYLKRYFPRLGMWIERFSKGRKEKHGKKVEKYGLLAITAFVAVPFPLTGAWTGSLLSVLFSMPRFKSILAVGIGIIIAASVVTTLTLLGS